MPELGDSRTWPEDLFEFAWFNERDDRLRELSEIAEGEDWTYHNAANDFPYPILFNYIRYTYRRLADENKIALADNGQFSCFNTGLVTPNQESLYASFEVNRRPGAQQPWFFKGWYRRGDWELTKFSLLQTSPTILTIHRALCLIAAWIFALTSSTSFLRPHGSDFLSRTNRWMIMPFKRCLKGQSTTRRNVCEGATKQRSRSITADGSRCSYRCA
jgi:hypothetical protein